MYDQYEHIRLYAHSREPTNISNYEVARSKILAATRRERPTRVDLSYYQLVAVPDELWQLTGIKHLNLNLNELSVLPPKIGLMTELEYLHLGGNRLDALPVEFWGLRQLKRLDLRANQLATLPREIGQLANLTYLGLTGNTLQVLPTELGALKHLKWLVIDDRSLPIALVTRGVVTTTRNVLDALRVGMDLALVQNPEHVDEQALGTNAEQRPAAYRFAVRAEKVDVLPEQSQTVDADFALDTYRELMAKAQALHVRLIQSNSARRACGTVELLLEALGARFDDLRPGVLLSRERSLAAIVRPSIPRKVAASCSLMPLR